MWSLICAVWVGFGRGDAAIQEDDRFHVPKPGSSRVGQVRKLGPRGYGGGIKEIGALSPSG
jgi:hypothetical protein